MFNRPLSISSMGSGMTTRSMARTQAFNRNLNAYHTISNSALGPIQRGMGSDASIFGSNAALRMRNLNNSQSPFTSTQSLNQNAETSFTPLAQRISTQSSLIGSTDSLGSRLNLGRLLNPRYASPVTGPTFEMQDINANSSRSFKNPVFNPTTSFDRRPKLPAVRMSGKIPVRNTSAAQLQKDPVVYYNVKDDNVNIDLGQRRVGPSQNRRVGPSQTLRNLFGKLRARRQATVAPGSLDSLMHYMPDDVDNDNVNMPHMRPPRQASRISNFLRVARSRMPIRIRGGGADREELAGDNSVARRASLGTFMNRHKRRLLIAGGIIGGVALIGGAIAGGISASKKRREDEMQGFDNDRKAKGLFEQLSSGGDSGSGNYGGGGGGGGFGGGGHGFGGGFKRFGQTHQRAHKYSKKRKAVKNTSKKLKRTKKSKKRGSRKQKAGIALREGIKAGINFARFGQKKKSINKRKSSVKKNRKRRRATAF
jgi:uncharacterized membrane protein YgcG